MINKVFNISLASIVALTAVFGVAGEAISSSTNSCNNNGIGNNVTVDIYLTADTLFDVAIDPGNKGQMAKLKKEILALPAQYNPEYIDIVLADIADLEKKLVDDGNNKHCAVGSVPTPPETPVYPEGFVPAD